MLATAFGASRGDHPHHGVDLEAAPGTPVYSPVAGKVLRVGPTYDPKKYPHLKEFQTITVQGDDGLEHQFSYVLMDQKYPLIGQRIDAGRVIGYVQDRAAKTKGMTNHVHYAIRGRSGFIDPTALFKHWEKNARKPPSAWPGP